MVTPMLNPVTELGVARELLTLLEDRIAELDTALTTDLLDRETYLQRIGARTELKRQLDDLIRH